MAFKEIHVRVTGAWKREACVLTLDEIRRAICPPDETAMQTARERWDMVAKPLHSLGLLEDAVVKIAGITGTADVTLGRRAVLMMCADNGVVAEGVTQTGQEVTAIVAENAAKGDSSVCRMARIAGADVVAVDVGIARPVSDAVLNRNIRRGTRNIATEPAMTEAEAGAALRTGIDLVRQKKAEGYGLFALGEMGIGNTTTSSAMTAVLLGQPIETVTGRGAGEQGLTERVCLGVQRLAAQTELTVIVTNELFSDGIRYAPETERYLAALSALNNALAAQADAVVEVVCGIPIYWKGKELL